MTENLNLPVIIYVSKKGCSACERFASEWEEVKRQLKGKARLVRFSCDANNRPPPCMAKYIFGFPAILFVGPRSYYRAYTHDDNINSQDYDPNYVFKAKVFNGVEDHGQYTWSGQAYTASRIIDWFSRFNVSEFDEPTAPKMYANYL